MPKKNRNTRTRFSDRIYVLDDNVANAINYMATGWKGSKNFTECEFLGFMPIDENWSFGVKINGVPYAAVHICKTVDAWCWGDDERDTEGLSVAKPWMLMFYGVDNTSYFLRFNSKENAHKYLAEMDFIYPPYQDELMYYNS